MSSVAESIVYHRRVPANVSGRDFFVGDVHGHYDGLMRCLEALCFNPLQDRLFSVGDLIDRGPDSLALLSMLNEPWFHAVFGNHELMFLRGLIDNDAGFRELQLANGGGWLLEAAPDELLFHAQQLMACASLCLTLETCDGQTIGICHTDPEGDDWQRQAALKACDFSDDLSCLWSRVRYRRTLNRIPVAPIRGVDHVVCGHVACAAPVWAGNQVFIDTLYRGGRLTVATLERLVNPSASPV